MKQHYRVSFFLILILVLFATGLTFVSAQSGGGYTIATWKVAGGGATFSTGGAFRVGSTIGQPDAGSLTGGSYVVRGGFWHVAATLPSCTPINGVQLSRTPTGAVFTGNTVHFTAEAAGTTPFTYTWALNGSPIGLNQSTLDQAFNVTGTFTVSATVSNACGQGSDDLVLTVQPIIQGEPDLSASIKSVNLINVEAGDSLTYTLSIRNQRVTTATAVITDPIPMATTYISDSARSSSGGAPVFVNNEVHWTGGVISGTPVVLEFAVQIPLTSALSVGAFITNAASLDDGAGQVRQLEAHSIFNPGYRLSINDGALYTNVPTVTLRYAWNTGDNITQAKFSNDGGFGVGTTDWLPVNPANPVYTNWVLATYGDWRLPRTVYARFRDGTGQQYGPFQDEVIYDPVPPQITSITVITQSIQASAAGGSANVIVRVVTSDDNTGANRVQLSHTANFMPAFEYALSGASIDIPWTLSPTGLVYARVLDWAGNASQIAQTRWLIYLPIVIRAAP